MITAVQLYDDESGSRQNSIATSNNNITRKQVLIKFKFLTEIIVEERHLAWS